MTEIVNLTTHQPRIYQDTSDKLRVEPNFNPDTVNILKSMGHTITSDETMGGAQSIMIDNGLFLGAADPRRPGAQAERNAEQLKLVSEAEGRLATAIDDKGGRFVDQIVSLRKDLSVAQHGVFPVFGRLALAFAVIGALAGLASAALSLSSGNAATVPNAVPAAIVAPAATPASGSTSAAKIAKKTPATGDIAPEQVIVAEGDSLSKIAINRGIPVEAMIAANPQLADPTRLYPGDMVNLPKAGPSSAE